jgi:hypothetical protein
LDAQEKEVWVTVNTQDERLEARIQIVALACKASEKKNLIVKMH